MKILFTGGGTGGHFFPIIAVSQALRDKVKERHLIMPQLFYMAPDKYSSRTLFDNEINYVYVPAGKLRRYFSILNFFDIFKTATGIIRAIIKLYNIYPDVVFSKGGYASFPTLFAARLLRIPVIIHESDSKPGRVNLWASKFAKKIAISYPSASKFFKRKPEDIAFTGNPIRKELHMTLTNGANEFLNLESGIPTILILGGSQGAQNINDTIIEALPELTKRYQVIHMTGKKNFSNVKSLSEIILKDNPFQSRYHPFDFLNELALRMSAGVAKVIISRAGSQIFEIALWNKPSIIIPLPIDISHDQTNNAFEYAKTGACSVIEETNLSPNIIIEEIDRIVNSPNLYQEMQENAKAFAIVDSADKIADEILDIALSHEV